MSQNEIFDPIEATQEIVCSYKEYIASTIHFDDKDLQKQLCSILDQPEYLAKGPFLEATPPYTKDKTLRELVTDGVLNQKMLTLGGFDPDRELYKHQVNAIQKAQDGKNFIVATGTGSGKTECFLLPIINDIMNEFDRDGYKSGVRAIILYPMNALANDQLKRLRILLANTNITFGRYTGDTFETQDEALEKWEEENPNEQRLPNELISRETMRIMPPNILLTNYSMLEYLLLRPKDAGLFEKSFDSWRHLVIDEAHMYTGALGTEIAYLIRRLKARIQSEKKDAPKLHCYATSATMGTKDDMPKVAEFAQNIFGESFEHTELTAPSVITGSQDSSEKDLRESTWGTLQLEAWQELRETLLNDIEDEMLKNYLADILIKYAIPNDELRIYQEEKSPKLGLGKILLGESSTQKIVKRISSDLLDLTNIKSIQELEIPDLEDNKKGIEILSAIIEVLSNAERSDGVAILATRYHALLRAPEGLYINLAENRLISEKTVSIPYDDSHETPIYEISVCRHCGQAYILGEERYEADYCYLNPKKFNSILDDDFLPRSYYRIAKNGIEDNSDEDEAKDTSQTIVWLCPICGTLYNQPSEGPHVFEHNTCDRIPLEYGKATETDSKCTHCGYTKPDAIQPMRVSPDAAGTVICYDLARLIPPFKKQEQDEDDLFDDIPSSDESESAGSLICFSDNRQDAAFFAPYMERKYNNITIRQLIREAVLAQPEKTCQPSDIQRWIVNTGWNKYGLSYNNNLTNLEIGYQAWAWILDELESDEPRNSLEGLGILKIAPTTILHTLDGKYANAVKNTIERLPDNIKAWIKPDDYIILFRMCLDSLRKQGALYVEGDIDQFRHNWKKSRGVIKGDAETKSNSNNIRFVGPTMRSKNSRNKFIIKYAEKVYGKTLTSDDSRELLLNLYNFILKLFDRLKSDQNITLKMGDDGVFMLDPNIWEITYKKDDDPVWVCDTCGCEWHYDTHGVCLTNNCLGTVTESTFKNEFSKDQYYKTVDEQKPLPLVIEEHTAQLSTEKARSIQKEFIAGNVNILSCTTTFELGVDVGDLRAVFMRNVPPKPANYAQRAGRTGRRIGMPGFAVTFARLRPHDIAYYRTPELIIKGVTTPPVCHLNNPIIAQRHIYSVALSEFFRYELKECGKDYSKKFNEFLCLQEEIPKGLEQLRDYLLAEPKSIKGQLASIFLNNDQTAKNIGVTDWSWIRGLIDKDDGRLTRAHLIKHLDYMRLYENAQAYFNQKGKRGLSAALFANCEKLEDEDTISVLADNGVLPKYGFPTDLVELSLIDQKNSGMPEAIELQRGLRLAIKEYAPGAEGVANKKSWKSTGIKHEHGRQFEIRKYGQCTNCHNFIWAVDAGDDLDICPVCNEPINIKKRMLIPSYGFNGKTVSKDTSLRRPRTKGRTEVYFSQRWPDECNEKPYPYDNNFMVRAKYASNALLCVLNNGEKNAGYSVCMYCGGASTGTNKIEHEHFCNKEKQHIHHFDALGTSFLSDVIELSFDFGSEIKFEANDWKSLQWALFAAEAEILEVPESEIGSILYRNYTDNDLIMLYDDVPGGAGYAYELSKHIDELLEKAYEIASTCTCAENTCCYGCLCNYYNQPVQDELSRGSVMRILGTLLGKPTTNQSTDTN